MGKRTNLTQQQIDLLAASFYPTILAYYKSEEGKAEYQKYLAKKAGNAKPADEDTDDKSGNE
ncbi:MAG: hypothetical protein K6C68_13670 [Ruminococcus sp.]|nr:hypothetical protein [Ruminococcus sp.]